MTTDTFKELDKMLLEIVNKNKFVYNEDQREI